MNGDEGPESNESRPSLSSRLNYLLNSLPYQQPKENTHFFSEPSSSRHSVDAVRHESMRHARTRTPSPRSSNAALSSSNRTAHNRSQMSLGLNTSFESTGPSRKPHKRDEEQPTFPVLRWFSGSLKQPGSSKQMHHKRSLTSVDSRPNTPTQYSDSPIDTASSSTTHVLAIADALDDDPRLIHARDSATVNLPSRPVAARLPPSMRPWRPPNHLSDLSRSTLPTASVSPTYTTTFMRQFYTDPFEDPFVRDDHNPQLDMFYSPTPTPVAIPHSPAPAHTNRSPPNLSSSPTRSSIETLRSIHERGSRGIHTTASSQKSFSSFSNPFGWFSAEDESQQENIDPFLKASDKASNAQAQKQNISQRCKCLCQLLTKCPDIQ